MRKKVFPPPPPPFLPPPPLWSFRTQREGGIYRTNDGSFAPIRGERNNSAFERRRVLLLFSPFRIRARITQVAPPSISVAEKKGTQSAGVLFSPPSRRRRLVEKEDNICAYTGGERGSLLPVVVVCCRRRCPGSSSSSFPFWALFPLPPSDTGAKKREPRRRPMERE